MTAPNRTVGDLHSDTGSLNHPIGVFDSGMGGLTVLRALQDALPHRHFLYLGDTARLPYGSKSPDTVRRYALQAAEILVQRGVGALVIACNTASAFALETLQQAYAPLPVFGVVAPGADAVASAAQRSRVLVLATESTVGGGAYQREILSRRPDLLVHARACPLLVTLAEEGEHSGAFVEATLVRYLQGFTAAQAPSTLLLGCTHFPVFRQTLAALLPETRIVDSAATTSAAVARALASSDATQDGSLHLLATDGRSRFRRVGGYFLGAPIAEVELVDL